MDDLTSADSLYQELREMGHETNKKFDSIMNRLKARVKDTCECKIACYCVGKYGAIN